MAELSPKRRTFDDGIDIDTALNPARNYPRKRVAVAVSTLYEFPTCILIHQR
jgi:hypothetical protein